MITYKKNTYNVDNIEGLAVNPLDPETILIEREQEPEPPVDRESLINTILDKEIFDDLDIEVLMGFTTRTEAAQKLNIEYDTYKKRLLRKIIKFNRCVPYPPI